MKLNKLFKFRKKILKEKNLFENKIFIKINILINYMMVKYLII